MKYVYFFGAGKADGTGDMREVLGGKGAGLAEMTKIGLPVPAGFTITTEACDYFYKHDKKYPKELREQVKQNVAKLEKLTKKKLRSEEHTSELQSHVNLVCRLLLEKKKKKKKHN